MEFYHPDLVYEVSRMFQSGCKIILSNLSQWSIYIHLKQKGSNKFYLSMLGVFNLKKCNQEINEVIFLKKMSSMVFDKFWFLTFGFDW